MADPIAIPDDVLPEDTGDVDMEGGLDAGAGAADVENGDELPGAGVVDAPARNSFLEYIKSPIVQIVVGSGANAVTVTAHQDLLTRSPYFEQQCAGLGNDRRIELPEDDVDAVGSIIEYLYLGDYTPRATDSDPSDIDERGEQLLKHARVYTLSQKFMMPQLQSTAHKKIQQTTSTARGEINYARYVYQYTSADDRTMRAPVAAFWATRSHVLRHEAEEEFRAMCLEFPQFGFDVLSKVLDQKEKRQGGYATQADAGATGPSVFVDTTGGRGRKRARVSGI